MDEYLSRADLIELLDSERIQVCIYIENWGLALAVPNLNLPFKRKVQLDLI